MLLKISLKPDILKISGKPFQSTDKRLCVAKKHMKQLFRSLIHFKTFYTDTKKDPFETFSTSGLLASSVPYLKCFSTCQKK